MGNTIRNDAKKALLSPVFCLSFLLMGIGYYFAQTDFTWVSSGVGVLQNTLGNSEWEIFGILGCTMPYSAGYCREFLVGNMQMSVARTGVRKYCAGKSLMCFLAGGMSAALGRCVLLALSTVHVPLIKFDINWQAYSHSMYPYELLCSGNYILYFCFQIFLCFLNGGFYASAGLCFSAFVKSPFMAWFAPYILVLMFAISGLPTAVNPILLEWGWRMFPSFWLNACYAVWFYMFASVCLLYIFYSRVEKEVRHGNLQ